MLELQLKCVGFENHRINTDKLYIHPSLFTNCTERECLKARRFSCCSFDTAFLQG